jgi:uncharacterized protein (DUF2164 family)
MVLAYVLLYQQLELLMNHSRIPTSDNYRNRERKEKLAKYGRIAANVIISLFLVTELGLMFICLLSWISVPAFYTTLYASFILVIIIMNLNQAFVYCKLVGSPYKSSKHFEKVRHLGIVCGVWSVAFAVKFLAFALGSNLYAEGIKSSANNYSTALLLAVEDFLTIVIPVFLVVDKDFIKIMAAEFLEQSSEIRSLED